MIVEVRKVISAPTIKKGVEEICAETGMSATEYAYSLIVADVTRRNNNRSLASELTNERFSPKTFIAEIGRIVDKYEKLTYAK